MGHIRTMYAAAARKRARISLLKRIDSNIITLGAVGYFRVQNLLHMLFWTQSVLHMIFLDEERICFLDAERVA